MANPIGSLHRADFPEGFVFGAAASAFQFEGAVNEDGRGPSICDTHAKRLGHVPDGKNGIEGVDFYHRYKEDVEIIKKVGLDSYRFSISWSRVLPNGRRNGGKGENQKGIDFYNNLINELLANGIEPYVTLFHFDLPQALEDGYGGFLNPRIVNDFCDYADLCFSKFGDRVKHWITINEPWSFSFGGYTVGTLAPGRGSTEPEISKFSILDHLLPTTRFSCPEAFISWLDPGEWDPQTAQFATKDLFPSSDQFPRPKPLGNIMDSKNGDPGNFMRHLRKRQNPKQGDPGNFIGLLRKRHNPKHGDPGREPYIVSHHQLLAHAAAVDLYKKKYQASQEGKIGITLMAMWMVPYTESESDKDAAKRALDFLFGKFIEPLIIGDYPKSMRERVKGRLLSFSEEESKLVKGSFDFIGLNYYTANYVKDAPDQEGGSYQTDAGVRYYTKRCEKPIGEKGGLSWLHSYPRGLMDLLLYTKDKYNDPTISITENGFDEKNNKSLKLSEALSDSHRISYHYNHLQYLKKAIENGVKVESYFVWSLHDNYEWANAYESRFGINYIDFENNKERYPKQSAGWFRDFLQNTQPVPSNPHPPPEDI